MKKALAIGALISLLQLSGQILAPILYSNAAVALPTTGLMARYEVTASNPSGSQGAFVTSWTDTSGNGLTATASGAQRPSINSLTATGKRAIYFSGSIQGNADCLTMPAGLTPSSRSVSVIMVSEQAGANGTSDQYLWDLDQTNSDLYERFNPQLRGGPGIGASNAAMYLSWGPQMTGIISGATTLFYVNGSTISSTNSGPVASTSPAGGSINCFGTTQFSATQNLYAVYVYNHQLSQSEVNSIYSYAAATYGVHGPSSAYLLATCGDSQTAGFSTSTYGGFGWVNQYLNAHLTYSLYDYGLTGSKVGALNSPDAVFSLSPTKKIVVIWSGTNDDATGTAGTWVSGAQTSLQSFITARRSTGWKVVMATMLPRGGAGSGVTNASYETDRQTWNSAINTNSGGVYGDAIADVGGSATIGCASCYTNTTYFLADGTHMTQAGYAIVKTIMDAAISSL